MQLVGLYTTYGNDSIGSSCDLWSQLTTKHKTYFQLTTCDISLGAAFPINSPIHTGLGCGFSTQIPRLHLSVNLLEVARGEISLRRWYASGGSIRTALLERPNQCERISRLCVSKACRSDSQLSTRVLHREMSHKAMLHVQTKLT